MLIVGTPTCTDYYSATSNYVFKAYDGNDEFITEVNITINWDLEYNIIEP